MIKYIKFLLITAFAMIVMLGSAQCDNRDNSSQNGSSQNGSSQNGSSQNGSSQNAQEDNFDYYEQTSVQTLPIPANPHWIFVRDVNFLNLVSGSVEVLDADTGKYLGMITTGSAAGFSLSPDNTMMFVGEGYYSRYVRGDYEDVVTFYDIKNLSPIAEVKIPPKRTQSLLHHNELVTTDDGKFVLVFNVTPASSVSVVDVEKRKFVGEISTAGCAQIFPSSNRKFSMICGDGTALTVSLSADGNVLSKTSTKPFFDPDKDPLMTRGARYHDTWYYPTYSGMIISIDFSKGTKPTVHQAWRLQSDSEYSQGWRPGGLQPLAISEKQGLLYVLMNKNRENAHKDAGVAVWVYDLSSQKRVRTIELTEKAYSIQVSADKQTLLYSLNVSTGRLHVYDGITGKHLRVIEDFSMTPTVMHRAR